jgi:hypothetical protein
MTTKTFIHVGLQKTATTFLQDEIFPRLREVFYVGRPYTQENEAFNQLQYADDSLYTDEPLKVELDKILKAARGRNLLISDELFSGYAFYNFSNRGQIARRLSQVVPDGEIILFIRNQLDLIKSLHNQYVKLGWIDRPLDSSFLHAPGIGFSLERWMQGARDWNLARRHVNHRAVLIPDLFDYEKLIGLYARLFSKVHVFLYEDFLADQQACIRKITSMICDGKAYDAGAVSGKVVNQGIANEQLESKIIQNKLAHVADIPGMDTQVLVDRIVASAGTMQMPDSTDFVLSQLRRRGIFQSNRTVNKALQLGMERFADDYFR